jgi:hypothetical protein
VDDYLMLHIVFDYQNQKLLKEKQEFVCQNLVLDEQSKQK